MSYELIDIVETLGSPRVLVIGDLILDRYIWGDAERVSQEAPVILLRQDREEVRLGGAANVANMLRGLDAEVAIAGVVGADADGAVTRETIAATGADTTAILADPARPTTVKERFLGRAQFRHPHQMLRVDREQRGPLSPELDAQLIACIRDLLPSQNVVLISDYAKGVCSESVVQAVIADAKRLGIPVLVDPAPNRDYAVYRGATAVTPNRMETGKAVDREIRSIAEAFAAGAELCRRYELAHAFVTLDSDGVALVSADGEQHHLPTRKREVYDITGAGDMVLSMIGVGMARGVHPTHLAQLANVAGGLEVEQIGVVRITRDEILADLQLQVRPGERKIFSLEQLARHAESRRRMGHRVVLTNGCFDLMHVGHVTYLQQAAREGGCLVVAVNSDASVRELSKAPDRPLFDEGYRTQMLAALECVDYVVVFDDPTPHRVLEAVRPDVLVKGGTYRPDEIVGREVVEAYGGTVKALDVVDGYSTTDIVRRLRAMEPQQSTPRLKLRKAG